MDIDKTVSDNQNDKTEDDMLAQALAMSSAGETRVCIIYYNLLLSIIFTF